MECTLSKKLMEDYNNDKLDNERLAILKSHLAKCPGCRKEFRAIKIKKYLLRMLLALIILIIAIFLAFQSLNKFEVQTIENVEKEHTKVVSSIVIDINTQDKAKDVENMKKIVGDLKFELIDIEPFSVKIPKSKVVSFISQLFSVAQLPSDTIDRVNRFIEPLKDEEDVIVEANFIVGNDLK